MRNRHLNGAEVLQCEKKLSINLTTLNSWETINEENYFAGHGIKVFWVFGAISDVCYVF